MCIARRHKVPFVFEVRDLWPQTLVEMGRLRPHGVATKILQMIERSLYRNAASIISVLPYAYRYIRSRGVSVQKIFWIPSGVDLSARGQPSNTVQKTPFAFMYFGALDTPNGIDTRLRAMSFLDK